jgi:aspartyl/asparaginyl-tRNA synthetase
MQSIFSYNETVKKLRHFFQDQLGYIEIPTQSRLSILAACEDPKTITPFYVNKQHYPLPQTGQMWLEVELLKNPGIPGVFCSTTSYRDEPNPIPGRHERIFPMFEFEAAGDMNTLRALEGDLLEYLGFSRPVCFEYESLCERYGVTELCAESEKKMQQDFGDVISLEKFPGRTHPFWNMKRGADGLYHKIDVILAGIETIGSAERSVDAEEMRDGFFTISDGKYSQLLFDTFGKDRVLQELYAYLSLPFFPRFGAGIGVTRLMRAMHAHELLTTPPLYDEAVAA